jgi:hypothetical protein
MRLDDVLLCQMQHYKLGDKRLDRRCQQLQTQLMHSDCAQSLPRLFNQGAQLKAFYRLVNNPKLTPKAMSNAYADGLIEWASRQPKSAKEHYLYLFQDTTVARFHGRKLDMGYLQNADDNGLLLHHGLLTDGGFMPLGLPVEQVIQRDRTEFGKHHARKQRPFEEKESYKWIEALDFARHFERRTGFRILQVADAECDIAAWYNYALSHHQAFVVNGGSQRQLADKSMSVSAYLAQQPADHQLYRPIRDRKGQLHQRLCALKWANVRLHQIEKPLWLVELTQLDTVADESPTRWCLLTNVGVSTLADAVETVDIYAHRWRTCEDFHKCLKTGCGIERRQFDSVEALTNSIRLLSLVAIRLLRLRHQSQPATASQAMEWQDAGEQRVASVLSGQYLSRHEQGELVANSVGWFWQLLARLGGHQGVRQSGPPGWQTIWKGYLHFRTLVDGYNMSKNEDFIPKVPTCG